MSGANGLCGIGELKRKEESLTEIGDGCVSKRTEVNCLRAILAIGSLLSHGYCALSTEEPIKQDTTISIWRGLLRTHVRIVSRKVAIVKCSIQRDGDDVWMRL